MKVTTIYTALLADLEKLGYRVYPRPYGESESTDITSGVTLHFYLEDNDSAKAADGITDRDETSVFYIDVNASQAVVNLTDVLTALESVKYTILSGKTAGYVEALKTGRVSTETSNTTYQVEVTYSYMERYE